MNQMEMQHSMDFNTLFDISATADFIQRRGFTKVTMQFPDEFLHFSVKIVAALRKQLQQLNYGAVQLYVMADTTYSSCCVDEVAAAHVNAECVIHYGHACFSMTCKLPCWFVLGKSCIDYKSCVDSLLKYSSSANKPLLVLFSLEYAYARQLLKEELEVQQLKEGISTNEILFADVLPSEMDPVSHNASSVNGQKGIIRESDNVFEYRSGGLRWFLLRSSKMEDCMLVWIGPECPALTNVMLTYNICEIARYNVDTNVLLRNIPSQDRILRRRYYLVERAKDADIIGIVVGTLGVAGYQEVINRLKSLIRSAGKKSYTFVMGRPNPAKLANFPECSVFIYVACPETAMLDSKEFLSPLITPYEAVLAFTRGSQWTGSYLLEFSSIMGIPEAMSDDDSQGPRFSFLKGGYVGSDILPDNMDENQKKAIVLANATEKALKLKENSSNSLITRVEAKSGAEFLSSRSYQGLEITEQRSSSFAYIEGRTGRAWRYKEEGAD